MKKPETVYEPVSYETLNKFLLGTLAMIRRKEIDKDEAESISKVADKVVKNNLTMIMDKNRRNDKSEIEFFAPTDKHVLIG